MMSSRWMWDLVCVGGVGWIFIYIAWWEGLRSRWWWILRCEWGGEKRERESGGSWSFLNPVVGSGVCCLYHFLCPFYLSLSFPTLFNYLYPFIFTDPIPNQLPLIHHLSQTVSLISLSLSLSLPLNQLMAFGSVSCVWNIRGVERREKKEEEALCFEGNVVWLEDTN